MRALVLSALALGCCAGQASAATRSFTVTGFDKIQVTGPFSVNLRTGPGPSARADGDAAAIDRLIVEVRGTTLVVGIKNRDWTDWRGRDMGKLIVSVTTPALSGATLTGSGDVTIDRAKAARFDLALTGSGDVAIGALTAERLQMNVTGSGDAKIAGRAAQVRASLQGSGNIDAAALAAADVDISIMGSGDAALAASRSAKVSLMGSGDVVITGKGACTVSKRGSGEVRCGR
jgi:hypothetical protein